MKKRIESVETFLMGAPGHERSAANWIFVRITAEDGSYGWGEASTQYKDAAIVAEILDFGKFLKGKDAFQIEHIWTSLHRRVTWTGGPVTMSAISGIDLALCDLKAKALGVPVYDLFGGKVRDSVPTYANGWFSGAESPEDHHRLASETVGRGWNALKFYPFGGPQVVTLARINRGVALLDAVRGAVGPNVEIAADVRGRLDMWSAQRVAKAIEHVNIAWLEEPILWDNVDALKALSDTVSVPISTGEQLYGRWDFRPLIESNAVRIIQPDICHAGGMTELRKIASAAEMYHISVAPHNSNGPLSTVASLQLGMCTPNIFKQEIFVSFLDVYDAVLTEPIVLDDGFATPPAGVGWGTDIDLEEVASRPPADFVQVESEPYLAF